MALGDRPRNVMLMRAAAPVVSEGHDVQGLIGWKYSSEVGLSEQGTGSKKKKEGGRFHEIASNWIFASPSRPEDAGWYAVKLCLKPLTTM